MNPELELLKKELGEQKRRAAYYKQLWMKERFANLKMYHKSREVNKDELYEANLKKFLEIASESRKMTLRGKTAKPNKRFTTPTREELIEQSKELERRLNQSSFLKETKRELSYLEQEFSMKSSTLEDQFRKSQRLSAFQHSFPGEEEKKQESPLREDLSFTNKRQSVDTSYSFTQADLPSTSELIAKSRTLLAFEKDTACTKSPCEETRTHNQPVQKEPGEKAEEILSPEEMSRIKYRIQKEVDQWTRNKSLRIILNKFFNHPYREAGYLTPDISFGALRKSYHKAVSKIHPDVHINSNFETKCRNQAIFLALQGAYERAGKKRKS